MTENTGKMLDALIEFDALPFVIGTSGSPNNPDSLPNVLPFALSVEVATGLIRQVPNEKVTRHLTEAYVAGSMLGTPMDERPPGKHYADDFLGFVRSEIHVAGMSILEIGAGNGYFLHLLKNLDADVLGVEPGRSNQDRWDEYKVTVINSFFPSPAIDRKFDAVIGFGVLEHIEFLDEFLAGVRSVMSDKSVAVFAVPDCTKYVEDGDPGMLVHEHWSYFTTSTLAALMDDAGFAVRSVRLSGYGGMLYVSATLADATRSVRTVEKDVAGAFEFRSRCMQIRTGVGDRLELLERSGFSLGLYVPGRALMWLDATSSNLPGRVRFFDDDARVHGRFYPPFTAAIESREDLLRNPVDELWIMSKSFGKKIASELALHESLRNTNIVLVDGLLREFRDAT